MQIQCNKYRLEVNKIEGPIQEIKKINLQDHNRSFANKIKQTLMNG
jgi:hypothetical protein